MRANHRPISKQRNQLAKTRYGAIHEHNPAGSKRARRFAKVILRRQRAIEKRTMKEPDTMKPQSADISFERANVVIAKHAVLFKQ